jgi:predicted PurR-regulated permease PerM
MTAIDEPLRGREWRSAGIAFFAIIALIILWATVMILRPFISAIILGAMIVTLTFPIFRRVRARLKGRNALATVVMLLGITVLIVIPAVFLTMLLVQQANTVVDHIQSGDAQRILARVDVPSRLTWVRRFIPGFDPQTVSLQRLVLPVVREAPMWMAKHGAAVVGGLAGLLIGFALVLLSSYYFYMEGETIIAELAELSPLPQRYDMEFATKFKDVIDATFRGQLFTSLAQGLATGVGLAIARVPGSAFWGSVAAILALLPMVGAAVIWVPTAIYLFISASLGDRPYWQAIFMVAWGVFVVSTIDNVVRPWAMKGKAQLPAIPLLFAVLGGIQAFGFIGLVIGPLVFSLLMSVIDIYKKSFRQRDALIASPPPTP